MTLIKGQIHLHFSYSFLMWWEKWKHNYAMCDFNNHDLTHRYISESWVVKELLEDNEYNVSILIGP